MGNFLQTLNAICHFGLAVAFCIGEKGVIFPKTIKMHDNVFQHRIAVIYKMVKRSGKLPAGLSISFDSFDIMISK